MDVNEAPEIQALLESEGDAPTLSTNEPFSLSSIIFTDPDIDDNPQLTIQEQGSETLPEWIQINTEENTLEIIDTPDASITEVFIDFIVDDGKGAITVETVKFSVEPQLGAVEPEPEAGPEIVSAPDVATQPELAPAIEPEPAPNVQEVLAEPTEEVDSVIDNEIETALSGERD